MIGNIFWTVVAVDGIAAFVLWKLAQRTSTHGFLVLLFLIILGAIALTAAVFPLLRSDGWRTTALILLLLPSLPLVVFAGASAFKDISFDRQSSGTAYFDGPALQLAQAIVQHDFVTARERIPAAGDLNKPHGEGMTLWRFAVLRAEDTDENIDFLRALIAAGADPKRETSSDPLESATVRGPQLTRFLLESGASPNLLDYEKNPLWWRTIDNHEDDEGTQLLVMMLDHGADLSLRDPSGRSPLLKAVAARSWYAACILIEHGADWKQEKLRGWSIPQLLEWEIIRREEWPLPIPEKLPKVLASMKGGLVVAPRPRAPGSASIPELIRGTSLDKLEETRAGLDRLAAERPDWIRRVEAFFEESDGSDRDHVALLLSLKPEALPEDVQERIWNVLHAQIAWFDSSAAAYPKEPKGWLLKETGVIAIGLASIKGPVRDRHRADFLALRDRIDACRKARDPETDKLADLRKADWL